MIPPNPLYSAEEALGAEDCRECQRIIRRQLAFVDGHRTDEVVRTVWYDPCEDHEPKEPA